MFCWPISLQRCFSFRQRIDPSHCCCLTRVCSHRKTGDTECWILPILPWSIVPCVWPRQNNVRVLSGTATYVCKSWNEFRVLFYMYMWVFCHICYPQLSTHLNLRNWVCTCIRSALTLTEDSWGEMDIAPSRVESVWRKKETSEHSAQSTVRWLKYSALVTLGHIRRALQLTTTLYHPPYHTSTYHTVHHTTIPHIHHTTHTQYHTIHHTTLYHSQYHIIRHITHQKGQWVLPVLIVV